MSPPEKKRERLWLAAGILLTVAKLWLTRGQSVFAIGPSDHDDFLFLRLSEYLVRGEWLGPYDQLTLIKGPFYPLWIAGTFLLGLPLFLSQHLLYAGACALFTRACRPAIKSGAARFALYSLLLWNPMSFDASSMGRVLRQHIYATLGVMIFAGCAALYQRRAETFPPPVSLGAVARYLAGWSLLADAGGNPVDRTERRCSSRRLVGWRTVFFARRGPPGRKTHWRLPRLLRWRRSCSFAR